MIQQTNGPYQVLSTKSIYRNKWLSVREDRVIRPGGGQGIFVDKERTASREYPDGLTVSVLHTESVYADELSDDGIVYHYPETTRTGNRDAGEIQATKNSVPLLPPMPFPYFARISPEDLDAIVAYLRTLPPKRAVRETRMTPNQ